MHAHKNAVNSRSGAHLTNPHAASGLAVAALLGALAAPTAATAQQHLAGNQVETPSPEDTGAVDANGIRYHYAVWGEGEPLLLLHGGLGTMDMFNPILPVLAETRQVIGVDLHGHGRTELGDRPIQLAAMADDLAVILERLG
ncbi:MAG TPA: alpha/beta fold hydrolase, partial [Longimicrobiales bacterium]|nr:alpha/beta fold hydrolase [Longimicrobiales bacterium]